MLEAEGGDLPYTWNVQCYDGMSFTSDGITCTVSWTPTIPDDDLDALQCPLYMDDGKLALQATVTDENCEDNASADFPCNPDERTLTLLVAGEGDLAVATPFDAEVPWNGGDAVSLDALGGSGGDTWDLVSDPAALPPGMDFTGEAISGAAGLEGTVDPVVVQDQDADGELSVEHITIHVSAPILLIKGLIPNGGAGTAYTYTIDRTDTQGPYTWSIEDGALPPGARPGSFRHHHRHPDCGGELCGHPEAHPDGIPTVDAADQTIYKKFIIAIKPSCGGE